MATRKSPPPFDIKAQFASLKTKYNIPDEDLPKPELVDDLSEGYMRRQDYDSSYSDLNKERQRYAALEPFEKFIRTLEDDYGWGPRENWNAEQLAFARDNRGDVNRQPSGLDEAGVQRIVKAALDKQATKYDDVIARTQRGAAMLIDFIPEARDDWRENYAGKHGSPKPFPKSEFEKYISPGDPDNNVQPGPGYGVPLQTAWNMYTQPFAMKIKEGEWEVKVKEAEEAGYRRARSEGPGSLEPFGDVSMSAGVLSDQQSAIPADKRPPEPSVAASRSRFNETYHNALRSQGLPARDVSTSVTTAAPAPAPASAPVKPAT